MREEYRMFKCWRYKINTNVHYIYETLSDGKEHLVYSGCSVRDRGKKCMGMQDFDRPCPLVLQPDEIRAITELKSSSEYSPGGQ